MAMSEASNKFDQLNEQGNAHLGNKQEAVSKAAETAMQLITSAGGNAASAEGGIIGNLGSQGKGQDGGPVSELLGKIA